MEVTTHRIHEFRTGDPRLRSWYHLVCSIYLPSLLNSFSRPLTKVPFRLISKYGLIWVRRQSRRLWVFFCSSGCRPRSLSVDPDWTRAPSPLPPRTGVVTHGGWGILLCLGTRSELTPSKRKVDGYPLPGSRETTTPTSTPGE